MPIGIYCDVHIPRAISVGLRSRGVRVVTAQEDGARRFKDPALLDRAAGLGCILYTHDADFLVEVRRRIDAGMGFKGVVHSQLLHSPVGRCIEDLEIIAKSLDDEDLVNVIEYIPF